MAKVLLGVTGSVAAIRTPELVRALQLAGHQVKVVATAASLYFFDAARLEAKDPTQPRRNPETVILDEDEWPGRETGKRYQRDDPVLHIELRRWAEVLVIAPLDANTLAKLAHGLSDNCLTCVWRAWDPARPVVLAPAMNTLMWEHPFTARHFGELARLAGTGSVPSETTLDLLITRINRANMKLQIVAPVTKRLACGDVGVGGLAEVEEIVTIVNACLASQA
jgi:phosphopantothenoylcysteine decarboxylase